MHVFNVLCCFLTMQVIVTIQTFLVAQTKKIASKTPARQEAKITPRQQSSPSVIPSSMPAAQITQQVTPAQPGVTPSTTQAMQELPPDLQALLLGAAATGPTSIQTPAQTPSPQATNIFSQPAQAQPFSLPALSPAPQQNSASANLAKLAVYKQKIAGINAKTTTQEQQQIITDFITEIIDPALTSKQAAIQALQDIQSILAASIINLKTLITSLRSQAGMGERIQSTTTQITLLSNKNDDVSRKIKQLGKIADLFTAARKVSIDNLQNKVNQYLLIVAQINQNFSDFYIQELIKDLYTLVTVARGQDDTKVALVKQLLDKIAANKILSKDQQLQIQGLVSILLGQAATRISPTKVPSPDDLKNKLASIQKLPTLFEKITTSEEALALVGDTTAQSEKSTLVNILKDFMAALPTMKKAELAELRNLFDAASKNPFLLAVNQQPVMDRWLKIVTQSLLTIDNANPLLASVKPLLNQTQDDYSTQLTTCNLAVVLATFNPPATEMDLKNSSSLASKIRDKIYFLYANRGNRSYDDLTALKNIFSLTKQVPALANFITPQWTNTLTLDLALGSAGTKKSVLDQLPDFQTIISLLSDKTDAYERQLFLTIVTNIFTSRKDRAVIELEKFKDLLSSLSAPSFVSKKIFDKQTNTLIETWQKILTCTLQLLSSTSQTTTQSDVQEIIKIYQPLIPTIALAQADYEKSLFSDILAHLFSLRPGLQNGDLVSLKNFFELVKKSPNILAQNQLATFNLWLQDLEKATAVTASTTTQAQSASYLDSLLITAGQKQDLAMFAQALALFTPSTSSTTKNNFVAALNTLFNQRKNLDAKKLLAFFKTVEQKKIGTDPLLSPAQLAILKQWETILSQAPVA